MQKACSSSLTTKSKYRTQTHEELTEVSALWLLKITLVNGSEVPEMSLGAKSLQGITTQRDNNRSI